MQKSSGAMSQCPKLISTSTWWIISLIQTYGSGLLELTSPKYGVFRNIQNIRSEESILMQLADFLMGAISYNSNDIQKLNQAKVMIIERISKHARIADLKKTNYSTKLNLFFIDLK